MNTNTVAAFAEYINQFYKDFKTHSKGLTIYLSEWSMITILVLIVWIV